MLFAGLGARPRPRPASPVAPFSSATVDGSLYPATNGDVGDGPRALLCRLTVFGCHNLSADRSRCLDCAAVFG